MSNSRARARKKSEYKVSAAARRRLAATILHNLAVCSTYSASRLSFARTTLEMHLFHWMAISNTEAAAQRQSYLFTYV